MPVTISSDAVNKLRTKTGAGMMDCKRALEKAEGDFDKAVTLLREAGAATAARRAGKVTGDGVVAVHVEPSEASAVLLELNCETDFVARTPDFQSLALDLARQVAQSSPAWSRPEDLPGTRVQDAVAKMGENIALRRFTRYDRSGSSLFAHYIHPSGVIGKVGVLVELTSDNPAVLATEAARTLGRELSMQVAAASPRWVSRDQISPEVLEGEKSIAREQARRENKPEKIWDKIAEGKVTQYCQQFCLLEQPFVKDPGGKQLVKAVLEQVSKTVGGNIGVSRFVRYKVAEEE